MFLSLAHAGVLGLTLNGPGSILVDGEIVPMLEMGPAWLELSGDHLHVLEARSSSDRTLATLELATPDGFEIEVEWRGRGFAVTGFRPIRPETTARVRGPGLVVDVTRPVTAPPPPPVATGPVQVEFLPADQEWANLWVDGEKVAEFRVGARPQTVALAPGPHRVELHDFMEDEVWVAGTLVVAAPGPIKVGIGKSGLEAYTAPGAWTPAR